MVAISVAAAATVNGTQSLALAGRIQDSVTCYYAQVAFCGKNNIKGFDTYGRILAIWCWVTVFMGVLSILLSIRLRYAKAILNAARHSANSASSPSGHPAPLTPSHPNARAAAISAGFSARLNQFEWFLLLYTVSAVLGALALTLSAWVNVSSKVFYGLMGPRNVLVYLALIVYVDMVLQANTYRDKFLDRIRRIYLRLLVLPITVVFGMFIYQGYLSDLVHYGRPELSRSDPNYLPPDDEATDRQFTRVQFINTILWLLSFIALTAFVIISRISFSRYLRNIVEPELERERSRAAPTPSTSAPGKQPPRQPRSATRDLAQTLRSAILTMKWTAVALVAFLLYSLFFAMTVLWLGNSTPIYYATLFVNWFTPTGFGAVIFGIVLVQRARQWRDVAEDRSEVSSGGYASGSTSNPGIAGWDTNSVGQGTSGGGNERVSAAAVHAYPPSLGRVGHDSKY
ncbi:hypothetical protein HDU96_001627 [Phlyctochytrium bullatum]|nr:hypothetical protein HDU96_001627 [Phlyctochytrium bullatum]